MNKKEYLNNNTPYRIVLREGTETLPYRKDRLQEMEQNFAFCEWVPYVVKTNSVFNKLKIYANTSFVFPLSKKSYDFSEALIVPPGGHLCEAEAPTEPTGETADPYDNIITDTYYKFGVILTIY